MEKKFDIIELDIDWEGPGRSVSRPIPRAPAVPASVTNEGVEAESRPVVAPDESAHSVPASPSAAEQVEVSAPAVASAVSRSVEPELDSPTAPSEDDAELEELEELEDLEEVEELDDSFLEPVGDAPGAATDQDDPEEPA